MKKNASDENSLLDQLREYDKQYQKEAENPKKAKAGSKWVFDRRLIAFIVGYISNLIIYLVFADKLLLFNVSNFVNGYFLWILADGWWRKSSTYRTYGLIAVFCGLIASWVIAIWMPIVIILGAILLGLAVFILEFENYKTEKRLVPLVRMVLFEIYNGLTIVLMLNIPITF